MYNTWYNIWSLSLPVNFIIRQILWNLSKPNLLGDQLIWSVYTGRISKDFLLREFIKVQFIQDSSLFRIPIYPGFSLYMIPVYPGFGLSRIPVYSGFPFIQGSVYNRILVYSGFCLYRIPVYSGFSLNRIPVYSGFDL